MARTFIIKTDQPKPSSLVNYRNELNDEQRAVVNAGGGPLLVIAGAGSGKTRTLTYRVARLLELGAQPGQIMLVTFTNRAAREMLSRVEALLHIDVRRIWGGTFHSIGNRILRRHGASIGFERNYSILDSEDVRDLIDSCVDEAAVDTKARRFPKGDVLREMFSFATNTDTPLEQVIAHNYPHFEPLTGIIKRIEYLYQDRKLARQAMDYDDLLVNWKKLLEMKPEIASIYQQQFKYILVDEYQDTNKLQADIIDLVAAANRNVMVVGDDAQSIFGWRGANVENILGFKERYPDAQLFKLETNYRSTPEILMLANSAIHGNRRQFPKNLQAIRPSRDFPPALVPCRDADQQAAFVAARVLELRDEGVPLDEIGVLYRSHFHAMELQLELTRRGIPYEIRSGIRFFEQAHIKDVTSYLRLIVNPRDEIAWKRVLRLIPRIGNATASKIWERVAVSQNEALLVPDPFSLDTIGRELPKAAQSGWAEFSTLIRALIEEPNINKPGKQIELIIEHGYLEYMRANFDNSDAREEDLKQLAIFAARYENTADFLEELALIQTESDGIFGEDVVAGGDDDEKLTLSSVHQAKGLEWRAVFLIWAADGRFPSARSMRDVEGEEEERRLFYVALTRARDELYVTYPVVERDRTRQTVIQRPSRFVLEVPRNLFEIWNVDEEPLSFEDTDGPKLLN